MAIPDTVTGKNRVEDAKFKAFTNAIDSTPPDADLTEVLIEMSSATDEVQHAEKLAESDTIQYDSADEILNTLMSDLIQSVQPCIRVLQDNGYLTARNTYSLSKKAYDELPWL